MTVERYYVYVVELRPRGTRRAGARPDVYVGSSVLRPEARLRRHLAGGEESSRHVRRRGLRLRPDLYASRNPLPSRDAARREEQRLRRDLERRGHRVYGACSPDETACAFS